MARALGSSDASKKRKAITKDSRESEQAAVYDELGNGIPDGTLTQEDDEPDGPSSATSDVESDEGDLADGSVDEYLSVTSASEDERVLSQLNGSSKNLGPWVNDTGTNRNVHEDDSIYFSNEEEESNSPESDPEMYHNLAKPTLSTDANGNLRYLYPEIDPVYDSDDSDAQITSNRIGNISLSYYDKFPHIGYDINGKKITRPAKGDALDSLLDSIDVPEVWTGLTDPQTGKPLVLNQEELDTLKRLAKNEMEEGYDPYPEMVEYFSGKPEVMPLSSAPEPKRRFVPSRHEHRRIMKIVKAIREGRIQPYKPRSEEEEEQETEYPNHDIWADEVPRPDHAMNIPAPKLPPPGYEESYHPPPEYLPDENERKEFEEADEEDRQKDFLAKDHSALRKVPGYLKFVNEKMERCLDLYLAPRVRRSKLNIDPDSLLPKLPSPEELRPFPNAWDILVRTGAGRIRSVSIDASGLYMATGSDDGSVRVWLLSYGNEVWRVNLSRDEAVNVVRWRPGNEGLILAAAVGESLFFMTPDLPYMFTASSTSAPAQEALTAGFTPSTTTNKDTPWAKWERPLASLQSQGVHLQLTLRAPVKVISFHRHGDYFSTVSPTGQTHAIAIHTLSKHTSQLPFRKLKGLPQSAAFHPSKPVFFVATQRTIRSYDLARQELLKTLQPGARWISGIDVHPGGDNLLVSSYDKRLLWMDLDLSARPYKTLRYHARAIRSAKFHKGGFPLFADASDDGTVQVFHGKVVGDLMENASVVPLKVLRGHEVVGGLGVLDLEWHPRLPWCVSGGADGSVRVWGC
ncbi:MAG: Ribosome biogenesis protein erb1 [Chrysothrix sp. TS-e1954]|nr:MAG: Ribosome biogenesis protein erb1 [Chrysothrix sp. TS-e1954]